LKAAEYGHTGAQWLVGKILFERDYRKLLEKCEDVLHLIIQQDKVIK